MRQTFEDEEFHVVAEGDTIRLRVKDGNTWKELSVEEPGYTFAVVINGKTVMQKYNQDRPKKAYCRKQ
jgi:hypothetical protein